MATKKRVAEQTGMDPADPRLPLKIARLKEARSAIGAFLELEPQLDDPAFDDWENNVQELLKEVFGASGYLLRFSATQHSANQLFHGRSAVAWRAYPSMAIRFATG